MTDEEKRIHARKVVFEFAHAYFRDIAYHVGQIIPGADAKMPHLSFDESEFFRTTMEPQEWLTMAEYGLGLRPNEDDGEMYEICQSMAEWVFAIPTMSAYHIPDVWYETPMGALWAAAFVRVQGDELITITEAAQVAGVSVQAISQRIDRGTLKAYTNPDAPNPRSERRLVRKGDVTKSAQ